MSSFTLAPVSVYAPKMGKKQLSLLTAGLELLEPENHVAQIQENWRKSVFTKTTKALNDVIYDQLGQVFEEFEMLNGARPDGEKVAAEYDEMLDDELEKSFDQQFWQMVGPSGQVELTTDTRIDEPADRLTLANKLVGEIVSTGRWLVLDEADAQAILADNPPKAAAAEPAAPAPAAKGVATTDTLPDSLQGLDKEAVWSTATRLVRDAINSGSHDMLSVVDELELCVDSDDILGTAGAQRLAPNSVAETVRGIMQLCASVGTGWTDGLVMAALEDPAPAVDPDALDEAAAEEKADQANDAATPPRRAPAPGLKTAQQDNSDGAVAQEIMVRYLTLSGMSEQAMADIVGVSRSLVNAAVKGRKTLDWTPDRVAALRASAADFLTNVDTFREEVGALA